MLRAMWLVAREAKQHWWRPWLSVPLGVSIAILLAASMAFADSLAHPDPTQGGFHRQMLMIVAGAFATAVISSLVTSFFAVVAIVLKNNGKQEGHSVAIAAANLRVDELREDLRRIEKSLHAEIDRIEGKIDEVLRGHERRKE